MNETLCKNNSYIINSFEQAKIAAKKNRGSSLSLVSAIDSAKYSGPSFFLGIKNELEKVYKNLEIKMWIDCGKSTGLAMNVIREGGKNIIFRDTSISAIREMAETQNVEIIDSISDVIDLS